MVVVKTTFGTTAPHCRRFLRAICNFCERFDFVIFILLHYYPSSFLFIFILFYYFIFLIYFYPFFLFHYYCYIFVIFMTSFLSFYLSFTADNKNSPSIINKAIDIRCFFFFYLLCCCCCVCFFFFQMSSV